MEAAVLEFDQTVNLATLRVVEISADIIRTIDGKVDFLVTSMTVVREYQEVILQQHQDQSGKADKKLDLIINMQAQLMIKSRTPEKAQEKEKAQQGTSKSKTDPADRRRHTLNEVKAFFSDVPEWTTLIKETKVQRSEIQSTKEPERTLGKHTDATGSWILEEPLFQDWEDGSGSPILWVHGSPGIGKSFIAETVVTHLEQSLKDRRSCAYFFFNEEQDVLTSWGTAICALSLQLSERDSHYCEQMAIEAAKTGPESGGWSRFFSTKFPRKDEDAHAYFVLDGIDEMKLADRVDLCDFLRTTVKDTPNIHVLLFSRPQMSELGALSLPCIELTKEKLLVDISKVIRIGCKTLPRLKKFRKPAKTTIYRKIRAQADGKHHIPPKRPRCFDTK